MAVRAATAGVERETAEATAAPAEAARLVAMAAALLATAALSQGSGRAKAAFDTPRSRRNTGISRSKRIDCEWEKTRGPRQRRTTRIFSGRYFSKRGGNACALQRSPTHPPALLAGCTSTCMAAVLGTHAHTSSSLKTSTAAYYICLDEHGLHGACTVANGDCCVLASLP